MGLLKMLIKFSRKKDMWHHTDQILCDWRMFVYISCDDRRICLALKNTFLRLKKVRVCNILNSDRVNWLNIVWCSSVFLALAFWPEHSPKLIRNLQPRRYSSCSIAFVHEEKQSAAKTSNSNTIEKGSPNISNMLEYSVAWVQCWGII